MNTRYLSMILMALAVGAEARTAAPTNTLSPEPPRVTLCDPGYGGPACDVLSPDVVPELAALPEPQQWLADDATGVRYRRATRSERRAHGWLPGTFLAEAVGARAAATRGVGPRLVVPVGDGDVRHVGFDLASSASDREMIEVRVASGKALATRTTPRVFRYLSRTDRGAPLETLLHVLAAERGGGVLDGMVGDHRVHGYLTKRALALDPNLYTPTGLDPATLAVITVLRADPGIAAGWDDCRGESFCDAFCDNLGITAPCSADAYNPCCSPLDTTPGPSDACHNNYDDDMDGETDHAGDPVHGGPADDLCQHSPYCSGGPTHSHRYESGLQFILLGEIHYCSWLESEGWDWRERFLLRGEQIVGGFAMETGHAGFDDLDIKRKLRMTSAKCWVLPEVAQARDCKDGSLADCAPFDGAPHEYPYAGAANSAVAYINADGLDRPKNDLAHAVQVGLRNPVNLVQVVMATGPSEFLTGTESLMVAGKNEGAYSVVRATDTHGLHGYVATSNHEFGHAMGLGHCHADVSPIDGLCTVMGDVGNAGGGGCIVTSPCDSPQGHYRFGPTSAEILYDTVRGGTGLPYQFGNAP